ncbi:hypothetical protein BDV11DRAFT_196636 [Aspergillus similis]
MYADRSQNSGICIGDYRDLFIDTCRLRPPTSLPLELPDSPRWDPTMVGFPCYNAGYSLSCEYKDRQPTDEGWEKHWEKYPDGPRPWT